MGAHADAAGEGAGKEARFEYGFQNLRKSMMDNPVPKRGGGYQARLRIEQLECSIRAGAIAALP